MRVTVEDRADIAALRKAEEDYRTGRDRGRQAQEVFAELDVAEKRPSRPRAGRDKTDRGRPPRKK